MAHHVCSGTAISVVTGTGKLVVVGPTQQISIQYIWKFANLSNILKEDGYTPIDTIGDAIFYFNTDPIEIMAGMNPSFIWPDQLDDFRIVACKYGVVNGHPCMVEAGQVSNGVHAGYVAVVPGYKTVFIAYRITGIPESNEPLFSLGTFCMRILPNDNTKVGSEDIDPPIGVPLGTNGTICVLGIQFALSGSSTDFAYIGTDDTSVTRVQNSWFNNATPAGVDDAQQLLLGTWSAHPEYPSPPMEWYEIRYYSNNSMSDGEMIQIRNEIKAQYE